MFTLERNGNFEISVRRHWIFFYCISDGLRLGAVDDLVVFSYGWKVDSV